MSRVVASHFVASPESVSFGTWSLDVEGVWVELQAALEDWDYNTDLRLHRTLSTDESAFLSSTRLPSGTRLRWSVSWRSLDTRYGEALHTSEVVLGESRSVDVVLDGARLGDEIELRTTIVLAESRTAIGPGEAELVGTVLAEDRKRVLLTGERSRFPVVISDFAAAGLDAEASWALDLPDDLDSPAMGGLMLIINERDTELVSAVTSTVLSERAQALVDTLYENVAIELLDHAVDHAEELESKSWDVDSIGGAMSLLAARFDGGLRALLALRSERPAAYRAALQGEARRNGTGRQLP